MENETQKRVEHKSGLNISQAVKPAEKALNGLKDGVNERRKGDSENHDIPFQSFARDKGFYGMVAFQQLRLGGISISLVGI